MATVKVTDAHLKELRGISKEREVSLSEAAEYLMGIGITRRNALLRYAESKSAKPKIKKASKSAAKKKPAAKKVAKKAPAKVKKAAAKPEAPKAKKKLKIKKAAAAA